MDATHLTMAELEAGLAEIRQAPRDEGTLALIVRRPAVGEREVLAEGRLDLDEGLVGDNWRVRGSRQTADGAAHPDMQLNIMNARVTALLAQERARWPLAGDQLYVDLDLSAENLPPGTRLVHWRGGGRGDGHAPYRLQEICRPLWDGRGEVRQFAAGQRAEAARDQRARGPGRRDSHGGRRAQAAIGRGDGHPGRNHPLPAALARRISGRGGGAARRAGQPGAADRPYWIDRRYRICRPRTSSTYRSPWRSWTTQSTLRLLAAGYERPPGVWGDLAPPGGGWTDADCRKLFVHQPAGQRRLNIHVRAAGRANQRFALLFRDYLRAHAPAAAAYAAQKRLLAAHLNDPRLYPEVKQPTVHLIGFAAAAWAAASGWVPGPADA